MSNGRPLCYRVLFVFRISFYLFSVSFRLCNTYVLLIKFVFVLKNIFFKEKRKKNDDAIWVATVMREMNMG